MAVGNILAKRWLKVCGGGLLLAVLLALFFPLGVKIYLAAWLRDNGADRATIEHLSYNPFLGRLTVAGVAVEKSGQVLLHNASTIIDVALTSLFSRDVHLEKIEYHDLRIDLEQYGDGRWRVGSYTTTGSDGKKGAVVKEPAERAWAVLADHVKLANCRVHLKTPELNLTLQITDALLSRFTTRAGQPSARLELRGMLNDQPLSVQLDNLEFFPEVRLGGHIALKGFELVELAGYLGDVLPVLTGTAGIDGKIHYSQSAVPEMAAGFEGTMTLAHPDIDGETLTTKADAINWQGTINCLAPNQGPLTITTDGTLSARDLRLSVPAAELAVELYHVDLTGPTTVRIGSALAVKSESRLALQGVELMLPQYSVTQDSLKWRGSLLYDSAQGGQATRLTSKGLLEAEKFHVRGEAPTTSFVVTGNSAFWQGLVGYSSQANGVGPRLELNGYLAGSDLQTTLVEPSLVLVQNKIEIQATSQVTLGNDFRSEFLGSLFVTGFSAHTGPERLLDVAKITLLDLAGNGDNVTLKGLEVLDSVGTIPGPMPLSVSLAELKLRELATRDMSRFSLASLNLQQSTVRAITNDAELLRVTDLLAEGLSLDETLAVKAQKVSLEGLALLPGADSAMADTVTSVGVATLTDLSWSKTSGLQGDALHLQGLLAKIDRDTKGSLEISKKLQAMQRPDPEKPTSVASRARAADESTMLPLKLRELVVSGKSKIAFTDATLAVPFQTSLELTKVEVANLDSAKPLKKATLVLQGDFDGRAPVEVKGSFSPFLAKPTVDLTIGLKNYPLASLSAYTVQSVGTALAAGQLRLQSHVKLATGQLDMKNAVLLQQLETATITPELAAKLNNQLPIPLDVALSLLRDNEDNISLDIPVQGPVSDLSVGISDVLITALGKAIIPAASGYLMYALGPYGALAYVGYKVGEKILQVQLPPVQYQAAATALTAEHVAYLERIAKILHDRPDADMQLCPVVASWELVTEKDQLAATGETIEIDEKYRERLLQLGQERAATLRDHLVKTYAINPGRLLLCVTRIDQDKKAQPAVLLQL